MKIIYGHDGFTEQVYGGVTRYYIEILTRICSLGNEISVLAGLYFNQYLKDISHDKRYDVNGLYVPKNLIFNKYSLRCANELYQSVALASERDAIYHQTHYSIFPSTKKINTVLTVYDMAHEIHPEMFHKLNLAPYAKKNSCKIANKIIAISQSTKKDLINILNVDPDKIEVIYLASDFAQRFIDIEFAKEDFPYILFVGNRQDYKNFSRLLDAFFHSGFLKGNFHLICFGGGEFTKEEEEKISSYKLDSIIHHRSGNDRILAKYYRGAIAMVYPSLYEGFGIPLLEAMSMHCPVICSNTSSLPEVGGDAAQYFNPKEVDSIQNTLECTLSDKGRLSELSEKGLSRLQAFSWDNTADKTLELYKRLI